jgi:hypothetical protein
VACPTAAEVAAQLGALLSTSLADGARDVATIDREGPTLRVQVNRPDGTPVGGRTFEGTHPCADLASAVALTIATWESDVHPEFTLTPAAPPEDAASATRPARVVSPPSAPRDVVMLAPETPRPLAPSEGLDVDVGAALATQASPRSAGGLLDPALALGMNLTTGVAAPSGALGARLTLGASTERAVPLGDGEARWRRFTGSLAAMWRHRLGGAPANGSAADGGTILDLHAALSLAALEVQGAGFSPNARGWSLDAGAATGALVRIGRGRWRPFVDIGVAYWPRAHVVYASPSTEQARLPRFDVTLALGVSFAGRVLQRDASPSGANPADAL